jgi:DNA-binding XRE family transcriptional regulator
MNRLIGKKIDSITVIEDTGKRIRRTVIWLCKCDCGEYVELNSAYLKRKDRYKACKICNQKIKSDKCREVNIKHGHSSRNKVSRTYSSWWNMKNRVLRQDKNSKSYGYYKDKTICERWINSFENFLSDMGERPEGTTIDRIDGTKGYYKENCKWSTKEEQSQNRSNTLNKKEVIEIRNFINENIITQKEIAEKFNVNPNTITAIKKGKTWKNI